MKSANLKRIGPFVGLLLFAAAAWVLHRELETYRLGDILFHIHQIPSASLLSAALLTLCSYMIMTGYDLLALRYIGHPLNPARTALASFLGYAFSNNIGFSMLAGASVRYRLYSTWGLSAVEITQVVLFCASALWLGFFVLSSAVFLIVPLALPAGLHWPFASVRPLGIVLFAAAALYFGATFSGKRTLTLKGWHLSLPTPRLAGAQIILASVDWLLAAAVLFVLLPKGAPIPFTHFLAIFLLAQFSGLVSQVPGGLGVFESIILVLAPAEIPAPVLLGPLIVYRAIYYLLPLLSAALLLGAQELLQRRVLVDHIRSLAGGALEALVAPLLSLFVFLCGVALLFSGALPAVPHRVEYLKAIVPLSFMEVSHFLGSVAGAGLLLLARGLQLRLNAAYWLTMILLGLGIAASLFKGIDYEEASLLAFVLVLLLPCRRFFFRRASLLSESFKIDWSIAVAVALASSIALGLFAYRHVEYSSELWWHFSFRGDAPRFMRASVGALAFALIFALARLLRPAPFRPAQTGKELPDCVPPIVAASGACSANLALLGDKQFFIDGSRKACIMYAVHGETWVAMGDPLGPENYWPDLLWEFRQESDRHADRAVFYEVGHEHLHLYLDMGLSVLKLGEEARVPLSGFSLDGGARKSLRYTQRKLAREGCTFEIMDPQAVSERMEVLKAVSDAWLEDKRTREKGFSMGYFEPGYIQRFPAATVRLGDRIVAFANIWTSAAKEELSIDLMRHLPDAPGGVMDFLFIELMLWGTSQGYRWFNLGMAPLSGMETRQPAPMWQRLGSLVARLGDHFYNFQGLRAYKQKFGPEWKPKYLATPGGLALPRILADVGALISGGYKGILFK